jgi:hypothetical protein
MIDVLRPSPFFQGSELPRLVILSVILVVGWAVVWRYTQKLPEPEEPPVTASGRPEPVVADRSPEFETVTDRTPMTFRDNAAYGLLLDRARGKTPAELAAASRRDILLTHLWERPELHRGVPIHLLGSALRVLRYPSNLSRTGWLYEAWIITPETRRVPYVGVFEEAPPGLPIGSNISERVVFNGYFLKILKYEASDVARGAPVLVGRIGWEPHESSAAERDGMTPTLRWTLIAIAAMFIVSLVRWLVQLRRLFSPPGRSEPPRTRPSDELDPGVLDAWVQSVARADSDNSHPDPEGDEPGPD